jgi:hypothetical protein
VRPNSGTAIWVHQHPPADACNDVAIARDAKLAAPSFQLHGRYGRRLYLGERKRGRP